MPNYKWVSEPSRYLSAVELAGRASVRPNKRLQLVLRRHAGRPQFNHVKPHRLLLQLIGLIVLATPAPAQGEKDEITRCGAIAGATERLACFDALANRLGVPTPKPPAPAESGQWNVSTETSPIDNSQNVYLVLEANESIPGLAGRVQPVLVMRCKEGRTEAYINWKVYLGLDTTTVLTRLDGENATRTTWSISTDNKATFHSHADRFLRQLAGHQKLLAQVIPFGESPAMVTFSTAGLDEAAKPLQEACHLK